MTPTTWSDLEWSPLDPESLVSAPCLIEQTLCVANENQPRRAKDFDYAKAVMDAWKQQETDDEKTWHSEIAPLFYPSIEESSGTTHLHGRLIRNPKSPNEDLPIVLFFHTGAGPHDLFLYWKASDLVQRMDCIVLICDLLGDDTGWAWDTDRTRYDQARNELLYQDKEQRPVLQQRIHAAIHAVEKLGLDTSRLGAMGWCLGGHPILELGRLKLSNMMAMASFHGVFDNLPPAPVNEEGDDNGTGAEILICHGIQDPFVTDQALERALETFQARKHRTSLLQLTAKHGFTNPAQDYNPNDAFAFDQDSADKAWRQAVGLLRRALGRS